MKGRVLIYRQGGSPGVNRKTFGRYSWDKILKRKAKPKGEDSSSRKF